MLAARHRLHAVWPATSSREDLRLAYSGALLGSMVNGDRRLLSGLVGELGLRQRIEFRIFPVSPALERQSHADATAVLALVLGDCGLQRLRRLPIPRQLVVARLVHAG